MRTNDWRQLLVAVATILSGCGGGGAPDPGEQPTLQTMNIFGMSTVSTVASDLMIDAGRGGGSTWLGKVKAVFLDQAALSFQTLLMTETQQPMTPTREFWKVQTTSSPDWPELVMYLRDRSNALTFDNPSWATIFVGHRVVQNRNCAEVILGYSNYLLDAPQPSKANRWSIQFAEDIKYAAETCTPFGSGVHYEDLFAWNTTHELGHQIAGLTHTTTSGRHKSIAGRIDVMNLSQMIGDIQHNSLPIFCYTGSRRGTAYSGAPAQDNCADNLHRFHSEF